MLRALLLLCLLHQAIGQLWNPWDGPEDIPVDADPNAGNDCSIDNGHCSCCLMVQKTNKLQAYFDSSLNKLQQMYLETNQSLQSYEASRTAVSAALHYDKLECVGPRYDDVVITYNHVFLNLGDAYNATTGVFTAPHNGVYSIALTIYADSGAPGVLLAACARLHVNENVVAGSRDKNHNDQEDSASIVIIIQLRALDQMIALPAVILLGSLFLCGHVEAQSTIELLKKAALEWEGTLTCAKWDCDCTFNRQRGCCCAANDLYKIEDDTFKRIKDLWHDISTVSHRVQELTDARKVAFKARMDPSIAVAVPGSETRCFGPFNTNMPIPYAHVTLNHDAGYNPSLGVFTAPRDGVYAFSCTVYSYVAQYEHMYHKVQLMKNGEGVSGVWENNKEDGEDSATQFAVLDLKRGDQVYVELMSGRKLCSDLQFNIFTGYIVYPNIDM
ncbi:uncharacterized protein V6R79_015818 [Siganus canaliculatus]